MIKVLNEEELYNIAISIKENDAQLPQHSKNFVERIGIKMTSEDGTNFLQGFAASDIIKDNSSYKSKPIHLWVNPACRNIGFEEVLSEHINIVGDDHLKNNYNKKEQSDSEEKVNLKGNDLKEDNKVETNKENGKHKKTKSNVKSAIGNGRCNHLYSSGDKESKENFVERTDHEEKVSDNALNKTEANKNNVNIKETKEEIKDFSKVMNASVDDANTKSKSTIDNITSNFGKESIDKIINSFNDPQAELPAISKSNVELGAFYISDADNNIISVLFVDFYKTSVGTCVKLLNIYTKEEFRHKGYASKLLNNSIELINNFVKENLNTLFDTDTKIILANAVGVNKEYVSVMLEKAGYNKDGESRGRINFSKEF